ncbi:hypothetical protein [Streptomyces sp. NPDC058653]|uniref:hypothetical protein n=1 Tax=Streptomyces sp. NPDC058653 TaxID=3346576 RepID=UPI0036510805
MLRSNSWKADGGWAVDGSELSLSAVVAEMKSFTYPAEELPLCSERQPFSPFSDELCAQIAREALTTPERRGRLTDAVRRITGQRMPDPAQHTTFESHVGLTAVDAELVTGLVALGFEPHNFAGAQPTGYHHNFTLQFVVDRAHVGEGRLTAVLREKTDRARELVENHPRALGFVESEVYRSDYSRRLPTRRMAPDAPDRLPYRNLTFREVAVPTTAREAALSGVRLDCGRAADVHIKIAGRAGPYSGEPLEQRIARHKSSRGPVEMRLGQCLRELGYYEQISQSGNFLYTAHFAELGDANRAFAALADFGARYGGIVDVVREACTAFWRKSVVAESGETVFASVPPLLTGR